MEVKGLNPMTVRTRPELARGWSSLKKMPVPVISHPESKWGVRQDLILGRDLTTEHKNISAIFCPLKLNANASGVKMF